MDEDQREPDRRRAAASRSRACTRTIWSSTSKPTAAMGIPIFALTVQNEPAFEPATYPGMAMPAATRRPLDRPVPGPGAGAARAEDAHPRVGPQLGRTAAAAGRAGRSRCGALRRTALPGTATAARRRRRATCIARTRTRTPISPSAPAATGRRRRTASCCCSRATCCWPGIRQWARGVVYWNLALDEQHGPHSGGCDLCKGVVTHRLADRPGQPQRRVLRVRALQPLRAARCRAAWGPAKPTRSSTTWRSSNPDDGSLVLVVVNSHTDARAISVKEGQTGFQYTMPAQSVATFVWNPDPAQRWIWQAARWWKDTWSTPARK